MEKLTPTHQATSQVPASETRGGIARIIGMHSESSFLLKDLLQPDSDGVAGDAAVPHLQLFYHLEEIFSQVCHEIRNYLSPIKGYASLISQATPSEDRVNQWSGRIMNSVGLMERQLGQLEAYRMKGVSQLREVNWNEFLADVLESFSRHNRHNTPIRIHNSLKGRVLLHSEMVKRVLIHLLKNAHESMSDDGAITVEAALKETPQGKRAIEILVRDEGCGISDAKLSAIWRAFFTTKANHFGLGLPYVAMAASVLDMSVQIQSNEGQGTTVRLTLEPQGGHIESA